MPHTGICLQYPEWAHEEIALKGALSSTGISNRRYTLFSMTQAKQGRRELHFSISSVIENAQRKEKQTGDWRSMLRHRIGLFHQSGNYSYCSTTSGSVSPYRPKLCNHNVTEVVEGSSEPNPPNFAMIQGRRSCAHHLSLNPLAHFSWSTKPMHSSRREEEQLPAVMSERAKRNKQRTSVKDVQ